MSQLKVDSCIFEGGRLPPPSRYKKDSNHGPLNEDDIRRIKAYKIAHHREIAKNEIECWSKSNMYQLDFTI